MAPEELLHILSNPSSPQTFPIFTEESHSLSLLFLFFFQSLSGQLVSPVSVCICEAELARHDNVKKMTAKSYLIRKH